MDNLVYGIKKKNKKEYLEYVDDLASGPEASFIYDRKYAKGYSRLTHANRTQRLLAKHNIETEVIVLREKR